MSDIEAITFEAQLWAVRHSITKKEEKTVITLHVHPAEAEALMNINLLNKRFQVAMAVIGDDEQPAKLGELDKVVPQLDEIRHELDQHKPRRKFSDLPRSQQAGMLCKDQDFWAFAAVKSEEGAKEFIYSRCHIDSRAQLDELDTPQRRFIKDNFDSMVYQFQQATGRTAELRS